MRRPTSAACVILTLATARAAAQGTALELRYGTWWERQGFTSLEATISRPLLGPVSYGFGALTLVSDTAGRHDAFYGGALELAAMKHRWRFGPYLVAGASLGVHTDSPSRLAALWSAGAGLEWNPLSFLGLHVEARYRALDRGIDGFWQLPSAAPSDLAVAWGATVRWGFGRSPASRRPTPVAPPARVEGNAAGVVETALAVMGTPYRWGGSSREGFDCSGLIQYAYRQHGISLPRSSDAQARTGTPVTRDVARLAPGDVLAFSAVPGGQVTHVGMYVGEGKFIHSASGGVVLSRLAPDDPDGVWWWQRWVGARRVLQE